MKRIVLLLGLMLVLGTTAAWAQDIQKPLLSLGRLSFAAGMNYAGYRMVDNDKELPMKFAHEFETGLYGAYNLTAHLSLTGSATYGMDNKFAHAAIGIRVILWRGGQ